MIENSTSNFRAGLVEGRSPRKFGTFRARRAMSYGYQSEDYVYGVHADSLEYRNSKPENCFSRNGRIRNFEIFEGIWRSIVDRYCDDPEEMKFMFPKPCGYSKEHIGEILALVFEEFEFQSFFLKDEGCLSLFSKGYMNGVSVDLGKSTSKVSCIYEGCKIESSKFLKMAHTLVAGDTINEHLRQNLDHGYLRANSLEQIKHSLCKVFNPNHDNFKEKKTYHLPDGSHLNIGSERFTAVEQLFYGYNDKEYRAVHDLVQTSISLCDKEIAKLLSRSIFLSGGSSNIVGIKEKLVQELSDLTRPKVVKNELTHPIWQGAFLCDGIMDKEFIKKEDYEEYGSTIIHRKCF